ncbi:hypothetical protein T439DRAFT_284912 [Meredithblackwellia eburnea MCA 4105]
MASNLTSIFPTGISLTGGIPIKSQDLAASVIFTIIYALIFPVAVWRLISSSSRCFALIRPTAFAMARIVTFIIRALQANGNYSKGLFIAEQVLLLCGFILLCEPLLTLIGYHMMRNTVPHPGQGAMLNRIHRLLQLALTIALILGIYAGSQLASVSSTTSSSSISTIKDCRDANAIICLIVTVLSAVVSLAAQAKERPALPIKSTIYLVAISALLSISSAYRLFLYEHSPSPNPVGSGTKAAFYLLSSVPEVVVSILYISLNLNTAFEIPEGRRKEKAIKEMKKGTYQGEWSTAGNVESQQIPSSSTVSYPSQGFPPNTYTQQYPQHQQQQQPVYWQQK